MSDTLISGKVASILNERELAINIGSEHGVKRNMKFKVLANQPTEVRDPETDEVLGVVDREKVEVQVIEVRKRFAVCRTFRIVPPTGLLALSALSFQAMGGTAAAPETLRANKSDFPPPLVEAESFVKRGDRVVQIIEP